MDLDRLYLDYNATSPLSTSVLDWLKSGDVIFSNPSSQHHSGKAARKIINEARAKIFSTFKVSEQEHSLFFHSGATEALYNVTHSFTELARLKGSNLLVCFSKIDHPAVTSLSDLYWGPHVKFLELKLGSELSYGHQENFDAIRSKKEDDPGLIVLYHHLWVHNETGIISPLEELTKFKTVPDLYVHVDAVQAPGKIKDWRSLREGDIWTFSAHKFGALKGIGLTLIKKEVPYYPMLPGGGQQQGMRGGTENAMAVKSVHLALNDLEQVNVEENSKKRSLLEEFMIKEMSGLGTVLTHAPLARNSNTIYFYLEELASDVALALFDLNGLMLSAGSACSSGSAKTSTILLQMGLNGVAKNSLRLSHSLNLSDEELKQIKARLLLVFNKLRGHTAKS